ERANKVPDLRPYLHAFFADGRMFAVLAEAGAERIVIKADEIGTPEEKMRERGMKNDPQGAAQAGGPLTDGTKGGIPPVVVTDEGRHLTRGAEKLYSAGFCGSSCR